MMSLQAQTPTASPEPKQFTLSDLTPGGNTYNQHRPTNLRSAAWMGDTFTYLQGDSLLSSEQAALADARVILTLDELNAALTASGAKTLTKLPAFNFAAGPKAASGLFLANGNIYNFDFKNKSILSATPYQAGDNSFDYNADRSLTAACNGDRLFILSPKGDRIEVSQPDGDGIVWGQAVHRNEFGINKGTFWSPDGKRLAFYRMDQSMVSDYPLVDVSTRVAELRNIKYPMAGMTSHEVTLGVFNPATGETVYMQTSGPKDHYLTNICWTPDGRYLLIAEVNRAQTEMNLNQYDAATGKFVKTLFTESSPVYVEPEHAPLFLPGKNDTFVWQSRRDGYNHLYLYNMDGQLLKQLTSGDWMVLDLMRADAKGEKLYFTSTEVSPLEQHLYELTIKNGRRRRLTSVAEGYHYTALNGSATRFYDRYSSLHTPGVSAVTNVASGKTVELLRSDDPYKEFAVPEIELGTIKAADGETDLYYRLVKPVDFDPTKKYPTIVYLYNGPHAQLVTNSWLGAVRGWDIYMAQRGYVMFTVDGRGSSNRGDKFEQAIHRHLGEEEGKDQMKGIEFLSSLPYVDTDRIGIHGWSYGGFMTTNMMLTYPETFKVGVAGGPVIDWKMYEVMYGERYMGHPDSNPEGYEASNLLNKVKNLQGHLLLIHGDMDPTVVMQHSLQFLKKSVDEGVYPDFLVYPGHEHNVLGPDRVHLLEKITRYFDDYLK
jgi:dipeptidyl aminopeptidase/acylaminoacyl peptidase